jgi:hypothetical protein
VKILFDFAELFDSFIDRIVIRLFLGCVCSLGGIVNFEICLWFFFMEAGDCRRSGLVVRINGSLFIS